MIHYEDMTKEQVIRILKDTLEYAEEKDREIERLNKELQDTKEHLGEYLYEQEEENKKLKSIIKEVREYIEKELDIEKICRQEKSLTICKKGLLEILDKVD